jgi:hypothetical protein
MLLQRVLVLLRVARCPDEVMPAVTLRVIL